MFDIEHTFSNIRYTINRVNLPYKPTNMLDHLKSYTIQSLLETYLFQHKYQKYDDRVLRCLFNYPTSFKAERLRSLNSAYVEPSSVYIILTRPTKHLTGTPESFT